MKQQLIKAAQRLCYGNEWSELLSHKIKALIIRKKYTMGGVKSLLLFLSQIIFGPKLDFAIDLKE